VRLTSDDSLAARRDGGANGAQLWSPHLHRTSHHQRKQSFPHNPNQTPTRVCHELPLDLGALQLRVRRRPAQRM
jgi:hypothetical protein